MSLSSANLNDVGVYNVDLTVSLTSFPGFATIKKNLVVTITCEVRKLSFSTVPPALTTLLVGVDPQSSHIPYTISQTPACGNLVNFSLNPTPIFLSLPTPTSSTGGNV